MPRFALALSLVVSLAASSALAQIGIQGVVSPSSPLSFPTPPFNVGQAPFDTDGDGILDWLTTGGNGRAGLDQRFLGTFPDGTDGGGGIDGFAWNAVDVWRGYETPQNIVVGDGGFDGSLSITAGGELRYQHLVLGAFSEEKSIGANTLSTAVGEQVNEFILPAYAEQSDAAAALVGALKAYCADAGDRATVEARFADLFLAWQRSSIVQMGPIMQAEGPMRVQLWPDPKGFSGRAIRAALQAEDPALLAAGGLTGRSIALTNLTALETLIYRPATPRSYACGLATAIARFQADLAAGLVADWAEGSAFRRDYDSAATGNARYPSVDAVIRDLLAGAVVYVDRLRKFKLLRGLGTEPGAARPERTEALDSGLGLASIEAGFRTLAAFYDTPYGLFDVAPDIGGSMEYYVLGQAAGSVADSLYFETASLAGIAAEDGPRAAELRGYADMVLFHERFLKTGFTDAIGLTAGFTAADGD